MYIYIIFMNNYSIFSKSFQKEDQVLNLDNRVDSVGRINIMQPPSSEMQFKMYEKISIDNKATDYRGALNGEYETTLLSNLFFCAENIQIIQNGIRAGVHKMSNGRYMVPNQNIDNLKIIMRSIFMQYSENLQTNITKQIEKLNALVLDYCVPNVYSGAVSYEKYCYDQSTIARPLDRQENHDRNFKQLEQKPWF